MSLDFLFAKKRTNNATIVASMKILKESAFMCLIRRKYTVHLVGTLTYRKKSIHTESFTAKNKSSVQATTNTNTQSKVTKTDFETLINDYLYWNILKKKCHLHSQCFYHLCTSFHATVHSYIYIHVCLLIFLSFVFR